MTPSLMTLSAMTVGVAALDWAKFLLSKITHVIVTLSITAHSIMPLFRTTLSITKNNVSQHSDTQYKNIQHNVTHHNNTRHNNKNKT